MDRSEIEINETHICVLKSNGYELYIDYYPLNFEFKNELAELKRMAENPNRTSYELQEYIENSPLKCLTAYFNYCQNLSEAYQGIGKLDTIDYHLYKRNLVEYKCKLEIENEDASPEEIQDMIDAYQNELRKEILKSIQKRVIPYLLDKAYKGFENQKEILAFSHRRVGFSFPEFQLSKDFKVIFKSNFGYGTASYFYTNIRYKEIDILPYSDWILYRFAEKSDIIRYTRKHQLKNSSWEMTMDFTSNLFNNSLKNPADFVKKWILNECIEMVNGLESLLNKNQKYEVVNSFFNPQSRTTLMGIELLNFKGEKISGALSFLDKIKELKVFTNTIPSLIERIIQCNLSIYHDIITELKIINATIYKLESQIDEIEPKWNMLSKELRGFEEKKFKVMNEFKLSNPEIVITEQIQLSLDNNFNLNFPRFHECKNEWAPLDINYNSHKNQLREEQVMRNKFKGYADVIEIHFNSLNRPLFSSKQG
jgi:hypothetical protein